MNFIRNVRSYLSNCSPKGENNMEVPLGLADIYSEIMLGVLSRKNRYTLGTFACCIGFHILLFLSDLNSYGCFALTLMTLFCIDFLYRDVFIARYTGQYTENLREYKGFFYKLFNGLRNECAILFYPTVSCFFWALFVISTKVPGLLLSLSFFLVLFLLPLAFQWLPEPVSEKIKECLKNLGTSNTALAEDELLPYLQDFNKRDADLDSLATDRTADSVTNSLASGISSMPSYLEVAEAPIEIQEEDLMPIPTKSGISFTPGELSSDSDSESKGIKFDTDHFNTSSSEDDPDHIHLLVATTIDAKPIEVSQETGLFRNVINSVGANFVANMFKSAYQSNKIPAIESESDFDFEVIDSDEIASLIEEDEAI